MNLAEVRLLEGESIENALRRFKRKVQTEDIIKEVKRHSFYLKPGAKRRVSKPWHESVLARRSADSRIKFPQKRFFPKCRDVTGIFDDFFAVYNSYQSRRFWKWKTTGCRTLP